MWGTVCVCVCVCVYVCAHAIDDVSLFSHWLQMLSARHLCVLEREKLINRERGHKLFSLSSVFHVLCYTLHFQIKQTHHNHIKWNASPPPSALRAASNQEQKALLTLSDENNVCSLKTLAIFLMQYEAMISGGGCLKYTVARLSSGASLLANGQLNGSGSKGSHKEDGSLRSQGLDGGKYGEDGPAKKR